MGIVTKKIGNKFYAYLTAREGKRVVHKYLGLADDPKVRKMAEAQKETTVVPARFGSLFWDTKIENIHVKKNARYIIERVLELGNLNAFNWLQRVYTVQYIINVLYTSRAINEKSRNFWEIWFGVENP